MADKEEKNPAVVKLLGEISQSAGPRQELIGGIQEKLGGCVVSFFTSFNYPVMIEDADADMIEDLLRSCDLGQGLTLILNSPGGSGLAAERIVNICRSYSGGSFTVIVPKMAKSAATMICMGASNVQMSTTAELGPIDPQVIVTKDGQNPMVMSVHSIVSSYKKLLRKAIDLKTGKNLDPLLMQLGNYDPREIAEYEKFQTLSVSIAVSLLSTGMLAGKPEKEIKQLIEPFTDPTVTQAHGRPIAPDMARKAGLKIEDIALDNPIWDSIWELYVRSNHYVNTQAAKLAETKNHSFEARPPRVEIN